MKYKLLAFCLGALILAAPQVRAEDYDILAGDERLACEAVLCLAGGWGIPECRASIRKFFSIWHWRFDKMIKRRLNFLSLCPSDYPRSHLRTIAETAGQCAGNRMVQYANGIGSTYYSEKTGNREPCSWNGRVGRWVARQAVTPSSCDVSSLSYQTRLSRAQRNCEGFNNLFEVQPPEMIAVQYCKKFIRHQDQKGSYQTVEERCHTQIYMGSDPELPAAQQMPDDCYSPYRLSHCYSITHTPITQ